MTKRASGPFASIAIGVALLAGLGPSAAQTTQPPSDASQAEVSVRESGFTVRSQVNLVSVPVVVRDAKGGAVGNLSREDFQLFDNGKRQSIAKFSVERFGDTVSKVIEPEAPAGRQPPGHGPALPAMPERFVAFFFDDLNTEVADLVNAREAAWRYLQKSMLPSERVSIATASGLITLDFTNDIDKLHQTLLAIHAQEGVVHNVVDCPPMSIYEANLIANFNDSMALGTAVADYLQCANSLRPPDEAAYSVYNFAKMQIALADRSQDRALSALAGLLRKMNVMAGQRIVVMASSGFQMLNDQRQAELDVIEQAIRSGVVVNTLDARGVYTSIFGAGAGERNVSADQLEMRGFIGGVSAGNRNRADPNASISKYSGGATQVTRDGYARQERLAWRSTLAEVASATGGHYFGNSNDMDAGFARLAQAPEYLYVLGFNPQALKSDGKFHALKVTLKDSRETTVETRKGYYAPLSSAGADQRSKEGLEESLFARDEVDDIPLIVQTHFSQPSGGKATLSIAAKVDLRKLSFRQEQGRNRGDLTVVTGIFDKDGNYVAGIQKVFELRLRDETFRATPALTVRNSFPVAPGVYLVRLVVRDPGSQIMASKNTTVEIR